MPPGGLGEVPRAALNRKLLDATPQRARVNLHIPESNRLLCCHLKRCPREFAHTVPVLPQAIHRGLHAWDVEAGSPPLSFPAQDTDAALQLGFQRTDEME